MISDTEARKSVAITCAPRKLFTPVTKAVSPQSMTAKRSGQTRPQVVGGAHMAGKRGLIDTKSDMSVVPCLTTFPATRSTLLISYSWLSSSKASNLRFLSLRLPRLNHDGTFRFIQPTQSGLALLVDTG
jgi:hypothetical protein